MNSRTARVTTVLLQRRARALKRHLPTAVAGDDHGVHQARVATRRLREAVPVLAAGLKGSKAGKAGRKIRRLTQALGVVRELDVSLHLLDGLASTRELSRAAVEDVRAHVIAERDRRRATMGKQLERVNATKLYRRLASVADALEHAPADLWRDVLAARLVKRAKRLAGAIDEAGQIYAPESLHQVRIAAKKLRYGLEIVVESRIGIPAAPRALVVVKRAQELLGEMHDLQVVQVHVAEVQAESGGSRGLEALARHIENRCRHLHGGYVASAPRLREVSAAVVAVIVPQMLRARRRKPLKMALAPPATRRVAQGSR